MGLSLPEDSNELKNITNIHLVRLSFSHKIKGSSLDSNTNYLSETLKNKIVSLITHIKEQGLNSTTNVKTNGIYLRCSG